MSDAATGWTDERVELLAKMWSEGLSASQIAAALGGGVTRNAVIGKVHRLGLSGRARAGAPAQPRPPKPTRAPTHPIAMSDPMRPNSGFSSVAKPKVEEAPVPAWASAVELPVSQRVTILELRDSMCRWPLGDPARPEFGFCGQRAATGLPYCGAHCRIAYQPAAERKRLRA
jgi:GcrA cell cycle regulator